MMGVDSFFRFLRGKRNVKELSVYIRRDEGLFIFWF